MSFCVAESHRFVDTLHEMQEFAAAEENLSAFCTVANLPEPAVRLITNSAEAELTPSKKRQFDDRLLGKEEIIERSDLIAARDMKALIESYAENIVIDPLVATIHFDGSTEIKEYFKKHKLTSNVLFSNTLAILDDLTEKGDYDLIFTTYGIVPVKSGTTRSVVKYSQVKWVTTKKQDCLEIDGNFDIVGVDSRCLFELCMQLRAMEQEVPRQDSVFKLPDSINPFKKPN